MSAAPAASVVVCVFNRGASAEPTLKSLIEQRFRDFEMVLVDDGSTDDTPDVLSWFQKNHADRAIRIVRNEVNLGVSGARNAGIAAAAAPLVFFTDSDCIADVDWLANMVAAFDDPAVDAVAGTVRDPAPRNLTERAYHGGTLLKPNSRQHRRLVGCNMGFRADVLRRFPFDPAMSYYCDEDDLARRLLATGHRIAFCPDAVVDHHHRLTFRSYLRMARLHGAGSARLWYKHGTFIGRDVTAGLAAVGSLPLWVLDVRFAGLTGALVVMQFAAVVYNERAFKGKTLVDTAASLPASVAFQAVKTCGVLATWFRLLTGREGAVRRSKRAWRARRDGDPDD